MRNVLQNLLLSLCLICSSLTLAPRVRGQDKSASATAATEPSAAGLEQARALFQRGVALADQGQFAPAAQRFREALAIHYAPPVAYNLAAALFELKQYDECFQHVQTVLRDSSTNEALRERAQKLERSLTPHVARLTVTASGSAEGDLLVRLDDQLLDRALLGAPQAVKPGVHKLSTERHGQRVSERDVEVPEGTAVIVDLSLILAEATSPRAVAEAAEADAATRANTARDDHERKRRIWLWSGVAAGAVVVATGVVLAVLLSRKEPTSRDAAQGDFTPGVLTWK